MQDAIVVGGGPAGSSFAFELARRGFDVAVFEEHSTIGLPSHCAGHFSIRSLRNLGLYPLPEGIVENTFSAANFYSPNGDKFSVHLSSHVTCAVNRARFDQFLAEKAHSAGAAYHLGERVSSLVVEKGFVRGVNFIRSDGSIGHASARLIVDAEGISSRLLRQASLQTLRTEDLVYAVEADVEGTKGVDEHAVEVYVGSSYAPGFYGWLIPRLDGTAKIGLAVRNGNPKKFLERLLSLHPAASQQLKFAKVSNVAFHAITLGGPIPKAYGNGFLAVGDCASQVKPTTGGGVVFGVICARIAAEIAAEALKLNDFSVDFLQLYQKNFMDALGFDVGVMLWARKLINSFSDAKLNRGIRFAQRMGFGRSFRNVEEIDFQGRTLITILCKPAAYATLAYLLGLYFSS